MGQEISRYKADSLFPSEARNYYDTTQPRSGRRSANSTPPKLKVLSGLTTDIYIRKEHFASGAFGRTYVCLDIYGRPGCLKEVRLEFPKNPAKQLELIFDARRAGAEKKTRAISFVDYFQNEVRIMEQCKLLQGPIECFKNKSGTRGYARLRLMSGTGTELMGDAAAPGLLVNAFEREAGGKPNLRRSTPVRDVLLKAAQCAAKVHARGFILSDIKPDNILYREGKLELSDFGLATRSTEPAFRGGTALYLAPETIEAQQVSFASDVYALGVTMAEWVLGNHPFILDNGNSVEPENYAKFLSGENTDLGQHFTAVHSKIQTFDRALGSLILRMMGPAGDRPSMREIVRSPCLQLSAPETLAMAKAWKSLPKRSALVWEHLRKLEQEIQAHPLPYQRCDSAWTP